MTGHIRPDFIVIGAQKSASTFIQNCLLDHPEIYLPSGETPYFEDPDYGEAPADYFATLFAGRSEQRVGIKRPNYIGKTEVPGRITRDLPDIPLIAVLRNPVDRVVAAYFHQVKYGTMPPVPMEEGIRDVLDGGPISREWPRSRELLEFGLYAKHLEGYRHFLEKGQLLCLLHDDISKDSLPCVQACYRHLGVDESHVPSNLHARPQKVTYSIPRLAFLGQRNRFLHHYNAERTRLSVRRMSAPEWLYVAGITAIDRYVLARIYQSKRPKLSPDLRARLVEYYRSDVERLQSLLSRDLGLWLQTQGGP